MATDITSVSSIIAEFRLLKAKDSVSPESLGYILQRMLSLIGSVDSDVQQLQTGFSSQLSAVSEKLGLLSSTDEALQAQLNSLGNIVASSTQRLNSRMSDMEAAAAEMSRKLDALTERLDALMEQIDCSDTSFMEFAQAVPSLSPAEVLPASCSSYSAVVWLPLNKVFAARGTDGRYYSNWDTADAFMDESRTAPRTDRLWRCAEAFYYWTGTELKELAPQGQRYALVSQQEYDAMTDPDPDTLYLIPEEEQD